jgi:histidine triad (HIT) family protein
MPECVFCQIAAGQIPAQIVYQDDDVVAFKDIHPKAPIHVLIIPRKHIASLADLSPEDCEIMGRLMLAVKGVAQQQGAGRNYKLIVNTGPEAGQVVMHLHLHLLGGKRLPDSP